MFSENQTELCKYSSDEYFEDTLHKLKSYCASLLINNRSLKTNEKVPNIWKVKKYSKTEYSSLSKYLEPFHSFLGFGY